MELAPPERSLLDTLRPTGRAGASIFAAACAERLRPVLQHVPSGAPPLVAGVSLTTLWRVLEGAERPDPRRLRELSQACWALVEIEPVEGVPTLLLELLVAAAHDALETYSTGNPENAVQAARKLLQALPGADEPGRQARDAQEIAALLAARGPAPHVARTLRERAEKEGAKVIKGVLG